MMNIFRQTFIMVLAALSLIGCSSRHVDWQLILAEDIMQQSPDSALSVLRGIDGEQLSGELQARHALLLSQAFDKNYIDIADDSLINIAFNFYRNSPDDRRLMQAAYYKAVVIYNAGNYLQSMKYAAMADTLANRLGDHKFAGLSASMMLYDCGLLHYTIGEIEYGYKAKRNFQLDNDSVNTLLASYHLTIALITAEKYIEARTIIESINDNTTKTELLAYLYAYTQQNERVDSILTLKPELNNKSWLNSRLAHNIITNGGNLQRAHKLLNHAISCAKVGTDITTYNWVSAELAKTEGRYKDYIAHKEWYEQIIEEHNTSYQLMMVPQSFTEGVNTIKERDLHQINAKQDTLEKHLYITISIILTLTLFIYILILNNKRKKAEFKQKIWALESEYSLTNNTIKNELSDILFEKELLSHKLAELNETSQHQSLDNEIKSSINILSNLCQIYKHSSDKYSQAETLNSIKKQIGLLTTNEFIEKMQQHLNIYNDNIIARIKKANILKDVDIIILSFIYWGLSNHFIAIITNKDYNYITVHRHRIKERLIKAGFEPKYLCQSIKNCKIM